MKGKKDKDMDIYLHAITMIDPIMGLIQIRSVPEARAELVANQVELAWLTRYPLPYKIFEASCDELLAELNLIKYLKLVAMSS